MPFPKQVGIRFFPRRASAEEQRLGNPAKCIRVLPGVFAAAPPINMKSVACKYELVMVALCGEYPGHVLVGENPVVHAIPHAVGIEKVAIANFHPEADGLPRTVRDQVFVKFPRAMRSFQIVGHC